MTILKSSASLALFMALLHTGVGLYLNSGPLITAITDGVGTIHEPHTDRLAVLWFMYSGALMFIVASFMFWSIKQTKSIPTFLGPIFLLLGIAGVFIIPASGFWLYLPLGLMTLASTRKQRASSA